MFSSNFVLQYFPDVDSCWTVYKNNVIQLMNKYVPDRITRSRKTNTWMNTETRRMVRAKTAHSQKLNLRIALGTLKDTSISNQNVNDLFGKLTIHTYKTLLAMMLEKILQNICHL